VYWKQFIAGWRRDNDVIPKNITLLVTNVCLPFFNRLSQAKELNGSL